ncbi:MAG: hypothetical protein H7840_01960 [Alphaproteobacteria bacterium]
MTGFREMFSDKKSKIAPPQETTSPKKPTAAGGGKFGKLFKGLSGGKKASGPLQLSEDGTNRLFLFIQPGGWRWTLRSPDGASLGQGQGDAPAGTAGDVHDEVFKLAAAELIANPAATTGLRDIVVMLEDADIVYMDGRNKLVKDESEHRLRVVGAELVGANKATFGRQMLGPDVNKTTIYSFANAERLSRQLGSLDVLVPKVTSVVPLGAVLLQHAAADCGPDGVGCTIHVSHSHTYVALANIGLGVALLRTIPTGFEHLVTAVATANKQTVEVARTTLATRDLLSTLAVERASEVTKDSLAFGVLERDLMLLTARLIRDIVETVKHFSEHRQGGEVLRITMLQPEGEAKGLLSLLRRALADILPSTLHANIQLHNEGPVGAIVVQPLDRLANLFIGAEGALVTVGKVAYRYDGRSALEPVRSLTRDAARAHASRTDTRRAAKTGTRKLGRGGKRRDAAGSGGTDIFAKLREMLNRNPALANAAGGIMDDLSPDAASERRQELAAHAMFVMMLLGALYFAYTEYETVAALHVNAEATASTAATRNATLRKEIEEAGGEAGRVVADKVLWTEKFLALGHNINNAIWLTDVFLADQEKQVGASKVVSKKMVMEGAVLPSPDGHILEISNYIKALLKDKDGFMSDFGEVVFAGAHLDSAESEQIVKFKIEAIYDGGKRIMRIPLTGKGADDDRSPLAKMQDSVKQRNQESNSSLTGGTATH